MKDKLETKKYPYAFLYIGATFICLMTVFLHICIEGGSAMSRWFFHNTWDTANDFFNCIPAVEGYGLGYWLVEQYPPLAKLFFLLMAHIYSYNNIPLDTTIRNSMTDPRMRQAAFMPFIIFILFTVIMIIMLISEMFKDENRSIMIGVAVIGAYSILYAIERGNIIILSFALLMYFICYYQSENKILKESALIALALSAGLKLYPAAFGILLIYERRWKDAVKTVAYGGGALAVPYIIMKRYLPESEISNGVNSVIEYAKMLINRLIGAWTTQQRILFVISIMIVLIGMIIIGIKGGSRHWINVFYAGVLAMLIGVQFAYTYAYIFLMPALVLFLKEEKKINIKNNSYFLLLCTICLPLPIFGILESTQILLVEELKMWTLFVMMIIVTVLEVPISISKKE